MPDSVSADALQLSENAKRPGHAPGGNGQSLGTLLGKILRIDPSQPSGDHGYAIPADNPFNATAVGANRAIWALGLRNPFTFAFQPV